MADPRLAPASQHRRAATTILRRAHLPAGTLISFSFYFMPDDGRPQRYENLMAFGVVGFEFWTGVIRRQLPRTRRFLRSRREATAEAQS